MIRSLIIDHDPEGCEELSYHLRTSCENVSLCGSAGSFDEGQRLIEHYRPELVFMEIEIPGGNGFELLRHFERDTFKVIFVTSHPQYAIKALRHKVADYLLKPVNVAELVVAVNNLTTENRILPLQHHPVPLNGEHKPCKIAVPVKDGVLYISPPDIIRMQADGTYTHIFTSTDKYTATRNIKEFESLLRPIHFFRSHHSHLINLNHVKRFSRSDGFFVQMSNGSLAELSRRKKDEFMDMMLHLEA